MVPQATAVIRIRRPMSTSVWPASMPYRVFLDGVCVGAIEKGETAEITVPPGRHDLMAWLGLLSSRRLSVDVAADQVREVELSSPVHGWRGLLLILYLTIWRARFLRIQFAASQWQPGPSADPPIFLALRSFRIASRPILRIRRLPPTVGRHGTYEILVDGTRRFRLKWGDCVQIRVPPGDHEVVATAGLCSIATMSMNLDQDACCNLEVGCTDASLIAVMRWAISLFRHGYLFLRRASENNAQIHFRH
jgi:hypothetical protein